MYSPGEPSLRNEVERRHWQQIATGITSEKAAEEVAVSQAVGSRWFRYRGGVPLFMSKPIAGRYLSFAEREEIALLSVQGLGVHEIARWFGAGTLGATYSNTQFKDLGSEPGLNPMHYQGSAKFHNAELNFSYLMTPALTLGVAYDYMKGYGVNDASYHQVMTGVDYFLSKRTDIYASGVYQHAAGADSTGAKAVANIDGASPSSTANELAVIAGIRHKF